MNNHTKVEYDISNYVYLASFDYKSSFGNVIKLKTHSRYNHSAISLVRDLDPMYTFVRESNHTKGYNNPNGFTEERLSNILDKDKNSYMKLIRITVNPNQYEKLIALLDGYIKNTNVTRYDFLNIVANALSVRRDTNELPENSMVCSEFVAYLMDSIGIPISDKSVNLVTPRDISEADKYLKNVKCIYEGKVEDCMTTIIETDNSQTSSTHNDLLYKIKENANYYANLVFNSRGFKSYSPSEVHLHKFPDKLSNILCEYVSIIEPTTTFIANRKDCNIDNSLYDENLNRIKCLDNERKKDLVILSGDYIQSQLFALINYDYDKELDVINSSDIVKSFRSYLKQTIVDVIKNDDPHTSLEDFIVQEYFNIEETLKRHNEPYTREYIEDFIYKNYIRTDMYDTFNSEEICKFIELRQLIVKDNLCKLLNIVKRNEISLESIYNQYGLSDVRKRIAIIDSRLTNILKDKTIYKCTSPTGKPNVLDFSSYNGGILYLSDRVARDFEESITDYIIPSYRIVIMYTLQNDVVYCGHGRTSYDEDVNYSVDDFPVQDTYIGKTKCKTLTQVIDQIIKKDKPKRIMCVSCNTNPGSAEYIKRKYDKVYPDITLIVSSDTVMVEAFQTEYLGNMSIPLPNNEILECINVNNCKGYRGPILSRSVLEVTDSSLSGLSYPQLLTKLNQTLVLELSVITEYLSELKYLIKDYDITTNMINLRTGEIKPVRFKSIKDVNKWFTEFFKWCITYMNNITKRETNWYNSINDDGNYMQKSAFIGESVIKGDDLMEPITGAKKLKLLTEEELPSKIEILMKDSNENIRKLGKELKKGLDTGFENLNSILGNISTLLLVGALTPFILLIVLSVLAIAMITVPSAIIITALSNQKRFIKSRAKVDEITKSYFTAVNNLIANDLTQSVSLEAIFENALEIISPIMEAPKPKEDEEEPEENTEEEQPDEDTKDDAEEETPEEDTPEENEGDAEPEEDESTDYTEDVDSPDEEEAIDADMTANDFTGDVVNPDEDETPEDNTEEETPEDEQPEDYTGEVEPTDTDDDTEETPPEDTGEETPEDYTADEEPTDGTTGGEDAEPEGEDVTADGEVPEEGDDTGEEEVPQEEPQDFTADVDGDTDDTGEDTTDDTGEETTDDTTDDTTETGEDNNNLENSIVKNYNLLVDYRKVHTTIEDILKHLKTVTYTTTIQNSVLDRCISNLTKIKEELLAYIEFNYSNDYKQNLYYYSTFIQALKINLDVLRSIKKLTEETKQ